MSLVKVIGIGSPYGNDTLGWRVIDTLKQQHRLTTSPLARVELIETDRPGINLIQMFQGADFVILVDAIVGEHNHGEVMRISKEQLILAQGSISSHDFDVASAIAIADKLGELPMKIEIFGLAVDGLYADPVNEEHIHLLADAVNCEIANYVAQPPSN